MSVEHVRVLVKEAGEGTGTGSSRIYHGGHLERVGVANLTNPSESATVNVTVSVSSTRPIAVTDETYNDDVGVSPDAAPNALSPAPFVDDGAVTVACTGLTADQEYAVGLWISH